MSLVTRLSTFFLAALALVLVVFSFSLGALAASHLRHRLDQRLSSGLDALEAAMHVEPDGLQWKPHERWLTLGRDDSVESVRWAIATPQGRLLDQSGNYPSRDFPGSWLPTSWPAEPEPTVFSDFPEWRLAARRLLVADMQDRWRQHAFEDDEPSDFEEFSELILVAGLSPAPMHSSLRQLQSVLIGLSLAVWLFCAVLGRRYCREALTPVTRLAAAAQRMPANDATMRLPNPESGDELEQFTIAFNGLLDRLHASADRQRRFASDASHQLRTPISGMLSLVEVIRRRQRSSREYEDALDRIRHEAARMRQIVESLLLLARNDFETIAGQAEKIKLGEWLPQQLQRWRRHARTSDFVVDCSNAASATIQAQRVLLSQLFDNILDNACKYSDAGTPISIYIRLDAETAQIVVEDQGLGVQKEDLARIFEPFYRASNALGGGRTGAGLGLAIVHRIADCLGGRIDVRSNGGKGTRFMAVFPRLATDLSTSVSLPVTRAAP